MLKASASCVDLLCTVIKEFPTASRDDHEYELSKLLERPENKEYRLDAYHRVVNLNYNSARKKVFPKSRAEIAAETSARAARAKRVIYMNQRCPNGLLLRNCTGHYLKSLGGKYQQLATLIKRPRETLEKWLDEAQVRRIMEK